MRQRYTAGIVLFSMLYAFFTPSVFSDDTTSDTAIQVSEKKRPVVISLPRLLVEDMSLNDTLDLMLDSPEMPVAGFDLKIGVLSQFLSIVEILPGKIPDSCGWEFFRASPRTAQNEDMALTQIWKITALAKMSPDTVRPPCFGFDQAGSIARIVVTSEPNSQVPDHDAAVFFFWEDCRDNVVSDESGSSLLISSAIFDYLDVDLPESKDGFPTRRGTPQACINPKKINSPTRIIEFHNGGVQFKLNLATESDSTSR